MQEAGVRTSQALIRSCGEKQLLTKDDFEKLYRPPDEEAQN